MPNPNQQLVTIDQSQQSDLATIRPDVLGRAIINALPGGQKLSTDQANGLAVASQVSGRNPFNNEMYMLPGIGVMDAAKSRLADFNEWLERHNDTAQFEYVLIDSATRNLLGLGDKDVAVEVRLHMKSMRDAWRDRGEVLRSWGVPWQEIIKEVGSKPPFHSAYGIVRYDEQKDDPPEQKYRKTAEQKWHEMDSKFSREERAKKRGRSALINSVCPVTTEQRKRMARTIESARQDPTKFVDAHGVISERKNTTHEQNAHALGRDDGDSLIDDTPKATAPAQPEQPVIEGELVQPGATTTAPIIAENDDDEPPADFMPLDEPAEPAQPVAPKVSTELAELWNEVNTMCATYEKQQRTPTEKQGKFIYILLHNEACAKKDERRKAVIKFLFGVDHYPDVKPYQLCALKDAFLKPRSAADGKSEVDPQCKKLAAQIERETVGVTADLFN